MYDVIIIGAGAAGLGAGLYAARYKLNVMIVGQILGGTGLEAHKVDNWIGDPAVSGGDLMDKFVKHVREYKVPIVEEMVTKVVKKAKKFVVVTDKKKYKCKTLIFALGMKHRKLDIKGEKEFAGRGVSYCYTCDAPFFKNKVVGVVGGSDSAALGALMLKEHCKKVVVLYRKVKLRAEPVSSEAVYKAKNIEVVPNVNVVEIKGSKVVSSVKLDNGKEMKMDGVFVLIGHVPNYVLPKMVGVKFDKWNFIKVGSEQETSVPGVFAAGDITNKTALKQFITAASEGSIAAMGVYNYLRKKK